MLDAIGMVHEMSQVTEERPTMSNQSLVARRRRHHKPDDEEDVGAVE